MSLHHSLRDLVAARGAAVVERAEELRGVLDDFLAEDEATLGELNLLVDAVRLGAVRRAVDMLDHGADAEAAVREAGAALARDRGTDDDTRSSWAVAALCFALARVDEAVVRRWHGDADRPATKLLAADEQSRRPAPDARRMPVEHDERATPKDEVRPGRAGTYLFAVLVALILGGLVATVAILLFADEDRSTAGEDPSTATESDARPSLVDEDEMLVSYKQRERTRIFRVDVVDGGYEPVTAGPNDVLPTLSPDRRIVTYDVGPAPLVLNRWDLDAATAGPFFVDPGPCDHAFRPGWSLDGSQVALVCTGDDKVAEGIYLTDSSGTARPELVVDDPLVSGSPTWISATELIYSRQESESDDAPLTFWTVDVTDGTRSELDVGLDGLQVSRPDYSPEADRVLFLASRPGDREVGDVWTMDPDGSNKTQVTAGSYSDPVWSPDGTAIGVIVQDGGGEDLGYVPLDDDGHGGDLVVVDDHPPGEVGIPVWASR